jgi:anaerobic magnesium-protoporphyrin IX monomethyl ester cyclase
MVKLGIGERDHWQDSDDLAMLFEGTYQTPFYRKLHKLLHRDLEARRESDTSKLVQLELEWNEFSSEEMQYRSSTPTSVHRYSSTAAAPDLSKRWN